MREFGKRLHKRLRTNRDDPRLGILSEYIYNTGRPLLDTPTQAPFASVQFGIISTVAEGWYESQVTNHQLLRSGSTGREIVIAKLESRPNYLFKKGPFSLGVGVIERIAVMEIGAEELMVIEKPAAAEEPPKTPEPNLAKRAAGKLLRLFRSPEISSPPVIVSLKKRPFPLHERTARFNDVESGFADVEKAQNYRQLIMDAMQQPVSPVPAR